jgi:hypothetical protein
MQRTPINLGYGKNLHKLSTLHECGDTVRMAGAGRCERADGRQQEREMSGDACDFVQVSRETWQEADSSGVAAWSTPLAVGLRHSDSDMLFPRVLPFPTPSCSRSGFRRAQ